MSDQGNSRFTPQNRTTHERLSTNTVGLVALSDFRKRRAEVLEQQEREAREAAISGTSTPDRSLTGTPDNGGSDSNSGLGVRPPKKKKKKKKKKQGKKLLSFDDEEDGDSEASSNPDSRSKPKDSDTDRDSETGRIKFKANASVGIVPKAVTKAALRKEATEREALRREFVAVQEAVKATEIAVPFVFYDGANTQGGTVRMKKGDFVWVFLDKSRKVGAELGVGDPSNARRAWARVGVDDLMLVRDTVIIPHHYDFHFFVMNKTTGPGGRRLFDYSSEAPVAKDTAMDQSSPSSENHLSTAASRAAAAKSLASIDTLEGASEDPTRTKVVDRRWYERNKHIYPASTWQEFDPEKDYSSEIRKDTGGNTYFFSK